MLKLCLVQPQYDSWSRSRFVANVQNVLADRFHKACQSLPDAFLQTGQGVPLQLLRRGSATVVGMDELRRLSSPAPCGKGSRTVLDPRIRRTLQADLSQLQVYWPSLTTATEEAVRALLPSLAGCTFAADLHSVLHYSTGDFFRLHRDAKKSRGHVLTLVVDCGAGEHEGGDVVFRLPRRSDRAGFDDCVSASDVSSSNDEPSTPPPQTTALSGYRRTVVKDDSDKEEDEVEDAGPLAVWRSGGSGSWAAWPTSEWHEVEPLRGGVRVVAIYNIAVVTSATGEALVPAEGEPTVGPGAAIVAVAHKLPSWEPRADASSLQRLPRELLDHGVVPFLLVNEYVTLAKCSKNFQRLLLNSAGVFQSWLSTERVLYTAWLLNPSVGLKVWRLGYALKHRYSHDGTPHAVPWYNLRGSDAIVADALRAVFGEGSASVESCRLVTEVPSSAEEGTYFGASVAQSVERVGSLRSRSSDSDDAGLDWRPRSEAPPRPCRPARDRDWGPDTELDSSPPLRPRFFPGALWLNVMSDVLRRAGQRHLCHSTDSMWGNAASFHLFVYRDAALMTSIAPAPPDGEGTRSLRSLGDSL